MTKREKIDRDDAALAAEYALGTLPHGERKSFKDRLLSNSELAAEAEWWDNQLAPMADEIEAVAPPKRLLKNIEKELFPKASIASNWWQNLDLWRGLSIASMAGIIVLGGLYASSTYNDISTGNVYVGQLSDAASDLTLVAYYDSAAQTLKLNRTAGQAIADRSLELWIIPEGEKPVSLGILPLSLNHEVVIPLRLQAAISSAILAVTDEPQGGSPSGDPTGAILAAGRVIEI